MSDSRTPDCDHFHMNEAASASDLIKTHPLRSSTNKELEETSVSLTGHKIPNKSTPNQCNKHRHNDKHIAQHKHKHLCKFHRYIDNFPNDPNGVKKVPWFYKDTEKNKKDNSNNIIHNNDKPNEKYFCLCCGNKRFLLSTSFLVAGYALLLVISIVVGVVVSQGDRARRLRVQNPNFRPGQHQGAVLSSSNGRPSQPVRIGGNSNRNRAVTGEIFNQLSFDDNGRLRTGGSRSFNTRVNSPPITTTTTTTTTPKPIFKDYDYVYEYVDTLDYQDDQHTLPAVTQKPTRGQPTQSVSSSNRKFTSRGSSRSQPVTSTINVGTQRSENNRQTVPIAFNTQFSISDNKDEVVPRGRKLPEVQIVQSWSHRNTDGSYSWGYINSDGSFKNETRGLDCVVRGEFGYPDQETGKILSFPYQSGNPCDPDEPDYYVDDIGNVMTSEGEKAKINVVQLARRRNFFQ